MKKIWMCTCIFVPKIKTHVICNINKLQLEMQKCKLLFTPTLMSSLYLYPRTITSQHHAYHVSNWILYITKNNVDMCSF